MAEDVAATVTRLVAGHAAAWDTQLQIPPEVIRQLAGAGVFCPQVPQEFGGLGLSSMDCGALTSQVGSLCSSTRSLMTSHGIAAWTVQRFGDDAQKRLHLQRLTSGTLAVAAFSEPAAGSDLSAMATRFEPDGDHVVVSGRKVWVTGAAYADEVVVFGRYGAGGGGAAVLVPLDAKGVSVNRIPDPLGCRAAGHADLLLDGVRLPASRVLGGAAMPLEWLVTAALTYGRLSVAWGCVGILRSCLSAAAKHAKARHQFGQPLAEHQLVGRHLAELLVAERAATHACEYASRCWDTGAPQRVTAAVVAKQLAATGAVRGAAAAVQILASAGVRDGHPVARAHRDAKLMEIIEGSTEIGQLLLARHAIEVWA